MVGIYKITNLINQKSYIGQSVDIESRWIAEKTRAFNQSSNSYDTILSRAFRKYGISNFLFEVIEECSKEQLNEKERYYIYSLKTLAPFGYNIADGGDENRSHAVKLQYDVVLQIIQDLKEEKLTQLEIADKYNISKDSVTDINLGHSWNNPLMTYPIRTKRIGEKEKSYCIICGKEITKGCTYCASCKRIVDRKVERPSKEVLLQKVATSSFSAVAKEYGVSDKAVVKWCKTYGLPYHKRELVELFKNTIH